VTDCVGQARREKPDEDYSPETTHTGRIYGTSHRVQMGWLRVWPMRVFATEAGRVPTRSDDYTLFLLTEHQERTNGLTLL